MYEKRIQDRVPSTAGLTTKLTEMHIQMAVSCLASDAEYQKRLTLPPASGALYSRLISPLNTYLHAFRAPLLQAETPVQAAAIPEDSLAGTMDFLIGPETYVSEDTVPLRSIRDCVKHYQRWRRDNRYAVDVSLFWEERRLNFATKELQVLMERAEKYDQVDWYDGRSGQEVVYCKYTTCEMEAAEALIELSRS